MATNAIVNDTLDRLAAVEPVPFPFISLYLNTSVGPTGKTHYEPFIRKEFAARARSWPARSAERESFEKDVEKINAWLANELKASTNGLVIFACAGMDDFFEAVELEVAVPENHLHIGAEPQLYTLAMLEDQYPRYTAVVLDTHQARMFVFGLHEKQQSEVVENDKTHRVQVGGWSQARYQRHVENFHEQHVKEVVATLDRVVRSENIKHIVLGGDEVILPLLREQMPQHLMEKVVDILPIDIRTPDHEVLAKTLERMRQQDSTTDAEKVRRMYDQYRAGNLGIIGRKETLEALELGQVDELYISTSLNAEAPEEAETLVTKAKQTSANVRFIEDAALLAEAEGVGALLRFKL